MIAASNAADLAPADARLMTETEKAAQLRISVSFLQKDRLRDKPRVPFLRFGAAVRYTPTSGLGDAR